MLDLKHTKSKLADIDLKDLFFIFDILCQGKFRSSKSLGAEVSCAYIRGGKNMNVECFLAVKL